MTVEYSKKPASQSNQQLTLLRTSSKKVSFQQSNETMSVRSSTSGIKYPFILNPTELKFVANDPSTYKQIVTIFNMFEFAISYKAFCTDPKKYSMPDWKGHIAPKSRVDIVIRLRVESPESHIGTVDKFRFQIFECNYPDSELTVPVIGESEINATIVPYEEKQHFHKSTKESFRPSRMGSPRESHERAEIESELDPKPNFFVIIVAVCCLFSLCLPTTGDEPSESWISQYVTLSVNQKLIAAFILGMVTMVIFKMR